MIYIKSDKNEILKRLKKRKNFNKKIYKIFKNIQLSLEYKKKKSNFLIKNDFKFKFIKKEIKNILKILNERNYFRHRNNRSIC